MPITLKGTIAAVEDISNDQIIAHRLSLNPDGGPALSCVSFDYETTFASLIGKRVQIRAFLDEVPDPEDRYNQRELIVTRLELDGRKGQVRDQPSLQIAC